MSEHRAGRVARLEAVESVEGMEGWEREEGMEARVSTWLSSCAGGGWMRRVGRRACAISR